MASLTKLFTGLLTMRLWEEGKLDLTRPVTDYAPQYRYLSDMPVEKVLGFEIGLTTPERIDTQKTPEAAKQQLWAVQPGEIRGRAYSDIHAMVIRDVIEGAAQSEYGAELTRCILRPLEMAETFLHVPEERRADCISCRGEHRIEQGKHILRTDAQPGIPHDPKAEKLYPDIMGHAGLFSTQGDMVKFAQGVLREQVISKMTIRKMARNRTGFRRADGTYQQYLGALCYVKHPVQYFSEIPAYESDEAIGLAGFTGQHMSIDIGTGVFTLFLGNRVMNRLTVLVPEAGKSLTDYGLQADGRGSIVWDDGTRVVLLRQLCASEGCALSSGGGGHFGTSGVAQSGHGMVISPVSACAPGALIGAGITPVKSVGLTAVSGKSDSSPSMGKSGVGFDCRKSRFSDKTVHLHGDSVCGKRAFYVAKS